MLPYHLPVIELSLDAYSRPRLDLSSREMRRLGWTFVFQYQVLYDHAVGQGLSWGAWLANAFIVGLTNEAGKTDVLVAYELTGRQIIVWCFCLRTRSFGNCWPLLASAQPEAASGYVAEETYLRPLVLWEGRSQGAVRLYPAPVAGLVGGRIYHMDYGTFVQQAAWPIWANRMKMMQRELHRYGDYEPIPKEPAATVAVGNRTIPYRHAFFRMAEVG